MTVAREVLERCTQAWKVTHTCVERWARRAGSFGLLVGALMAPPSGPRHFKFLAEDAAPFIDFPLRPGPAGELEPENPEGLSIATVRAVYSRMVVHADVHGTLFGGVRFIAGELGIDPRTVRRAQRTLRRLGYLVSFKRWEVDERAPRNQVRTNVHLLRLGPDPVAASDPAACSVPRREGAAPPPKAAPPSEPVPVELRPLEGPLQQLATVTRIRVDVSTAAQSAALAGLTVREACVVIGDLCVKAATGIAADDDVWTSKRGLHSMLGSFCTAAGERKRRAPAASSQPPEAGSPEERVRRHVAQQLAEERRLQADADSALERARLAARPRVVTPPAPKRPP